MAPGIPTTNWSTRNMRKDLLARMKLIASINRCTVEETANTLLEIGLKDVEKRLKLHKRLLD